MVAMESPRAIVALSGGKASAWCADWALRTYPRESVVLYFNDTKWEHPDLYRFLSDLEKHFDLKITVDSDGRSPEQLFYSKNTLANNRMPFCSSVLKAQRLQRYFRNGDNLIFGISGDEAHRANRLVAVYHEIGVKTGRWPKLVFPLIAERVSREQIDAFLRTIGIEEPLLYRLGFEHNNCSGGCVRAGKKQWKLLYEKLPEVYADRERVEREMRRYTGKDISFFKDETLEEFRGRIERKELPAYYYANHDPMQPSLFETECIGVCSSMS